MQNKEDFGFYGEGNDESKVKDIQGITDTVTDYTYTNLEYPCIMLKEGFTCPKHKMKVISNMVKTTSDDKDISLYFVESGELFKIGMLGGLQVSSFIDIVGVENLVGYFLDGTKLEGSKIYTLCTF